MKSLPWVSVLLAVLLAISPWGRDVLWTSFASNEQLSRNISSAILLIVCAAFVAVMAFEWLLRCWLRRRARGRQEA